MSVSKVSLIRSPSTTMWESTGDKTSGEDILRPPCCRGRCKLAAYKLSVLRGSRSTYKIFFFPGREASRMFPITRTLLLVATGHFRMPAASWYPMIAATNFLSSYGRLIRNKDETKQLDNFLFTFPIHYFKIIHDGTYCIRVIIFVVKITAAYLCCDI